MHITGSSLRVIWACLKKDLKSARSEPLYTLVSIILPLNVLVLMSLLVISGGLAPTAVVMQDTGPLAQQFYAAMSQAHSFVLQRASAEQADALIEQGRIVAVVTIPADFDACIQEHQNVSIRVQINNLNTDFTNDIRRAVPDAITQFYQQRGGKSPIRVTLSEQNLRRQDIQLFQYSAMPLLVLLLVVSGLVSSSLAAVGGWETRTIKELLLSPASSGAIICGKVLTGFVTTTALGVLILGGGALLGWVQPAGVYWLPGLLILALVALFSAGLGVALGALLQRIQSVGSVAIVIALYLFFLTGERRCWPLTRRGCKRLRPSCPCTTVGTLWRWQSSTSRLTSLAGMLRCWQAQPCSPWAWVSWRCAGAWPSPAKESTSVREGGKV